MICVAISLANVRIKPDIEATEFFVQDSDSISYGLLMIYNDRIDMHGLSQRRF